MLIDSHAHLNFKVFDKDREDVINKTLEKNISVINVSTNLDSSRKAVKIAEMNDDRVKAAIGLHPLNIKQGGKDKEEKRPEDKLEEDFNIDEYKKIAKSNEVVAVGEIGLDYWYKPKTKKKQAIFKSKQKQILLKQLDFAKELNLPVIFHSRVAHSDLVETINEVKSNWGYDIKAVIHSFSGSWEDAKEYLNFGFYLGFSGLIFKLNVDETIKNVPLERILLETDCPFLTPPMVKEKRNEPINVKYVAERISELREESIERIAEESSKNAKDFFNI